MIPNITLVIQGIVFFAVVWLVMKFIWPHIIAAIEERQAKIAEGLAAADRARQELADADSRVADEIRKARVEAVAIVDKASHQAGQIESMAHRAREELRTKVASLAIAGAEKILKREIDPNAHKDLLDQLVSEI